MNKIAKVVVPIALDKEFDYFYPSRLFLKKGMRVIVDFKGRRLLGIVTGLSKTSRIKKLKPIIDVLGAKPILGPEKMKFAEKLSDIYACSRGEFLFMMLPSYLRKTKKFNFEYVRAKKNKTVKSSPEFIRADSFLERYHLWRDKVRKALKNGSALICLPQISYLHRVKQVLERDFPNKIKLFHSQEKEKEFFLNWQRSREKSLILGTRVSLFYYPQDLELIIIEEENSRYYFQEEKPYHTLGEAANLLSKMKGVDLVLSGDYPSLSSYNRIKNGEVSLIDKKESCDNIKVVNLAEFNRRKIITPILSELLRKIIKTNKKGVVLWNKKGFARVISCSGCGYILKCGRCSSFLQSSLKSRELACPYCQKKTNLPSACGHCRAGYFKSSGFGIERIETVLKRIFPEVKIDNISKAAADSQIIIATSKILNHLYDSQNLGVGFVLDADSFLASAEYSAGFDAFLYFKRLSLLFKDTLYVFTRNKDYYLFQRLNENWKCFYDSELELRKDLNLPPLGLITKITLRAKNEKRLLEKTEILFNQLKKKFPEIYGPFQEKPFKLRDKFRYSLTIKTKKSLKFRKIIKEEVKKFRPSSTQLALIYC